MNPVEQVAQQLLLGSAVRQNHALEHATISLLGKKHPSIRFSGVSIAAGFFVFADIPTEDVLPAAEEALRRLRGGEPEMAIHERCGTNLAMAGTLTALSSVLVSRMRRPYNSMNNVILASTAALLASRPLGMMAQKYVTTLTPNSSMEITGVRRFILLNSPAHFVSTNNPDSHGIFG